MLTVWQAKATRPCPPDLNVRNRGPGSPKHPGAGRLTKARACQSPATSSLPALGCAERLGNRKTAPGTDRKSTRLNSSHGYISYAVFHLKKKRPTPPPSPPRTATAITTPPPPPPPTR